MNYRRCQGRLMQDGALQVSALTFSSIPAFVARELLDDDALQQTVLEASGLYIPTTYEELLSALGETLSDGEIVFSEEIDFEQDGSPEFLVIGLGNSGGSHEDFADEGHYPYRRIWFTIYRNSAEGIRGVIGKPPVIALGMFSQSCSLVERDGRLFLKCTGESATTGTFEEYFGSVAERDGGRDDWGMTDYIHDGRVSIINEKGFVDDANNNRHIWGEELQAYLNRYTAVRELYRADGIDAE